MATMFTAKDLEVYKDSLKEKKNKTKPAEKPSKTPPSVAKLPKPPLKLNNEDPHKERKPLSVVHKTSSNTIKDPQKPPHSPTPVGSSKQPDQWRKVKEAASKTPLPGKIQTAEANSVVKPLEFKIEPLKSPRDALLPKSPIIKSDNGKAAGAVRKPSTLVSPVNQKGPSLSGAKAPPTFDVNASLCSECTRSASEGAVCFIGNDGRVSACTTRSAVRLCKNLNCAANNPEYVAAMANAPKKYLVSKRHLLKAQFGPKSKTGHPKSPNVHQTDAPGNDGMPSSQDAVSASIQGPSPLYADVNGANSSASEADDGDLSLLEGSLKQFDEELSLLDGNLGFDKVGTALANGDMYSIEDVAVEESIDFSFHDGEAGEAVSPKILVKESHKDLNEMHSASGSDNFQEDTGANDNLHEYAESLSTDNFEERDEEDLDESSMHRESKAEELLINYGDLAWSEEADVDDHSGNAVGFTLGTQMGDNLVVSITEGVGQVLQTVACENAGEGNQLGDRSPQDTENSQESNPQPASVGRGALDHVCVDETTPTVEDKQLVDENTNDSGTPGDAGQLVDDVKSGDLTTIMDTLIADDNQKDSNIDNDQRVSDLKIEGLTTTNDTHMAHDNQNGIGIGDGFEERGDIALPFIPADDHEDNSIPLFAQDDGASGTTLCHLTQVDDNEVAQDDGASGTTLCHVRQVDDNEVAQDDGASGTTLCHVTQVDDNEVGITTLHGAEDEGCDDDTTSRYENRHVEDDEIASRHDSGHIEEDDEIASRHDSGHIEEDESDGDYSEDDQPDAMMSNTNITQDSMHVGTQEEMEKSLNERTSKGQDGNESSNSSRRQRRRRVLRVVEEVSPETVILRKQQMLERKQAEEWLINHAIEGVVHKLAPTGDAKVKILVEAFESIISNTDVESIDTHNPRQEKRAAIA